MMTNSDGHKKAMVEALKKSLGNVTEACKMVPIARQTHYRWLEEDESYKADVEGIADEAIDFVESKLFEKISGVQVKRGENDEGEPIVYDHPPSDTAIIFYLKTKGKKRGYVEKSEVGFTDKDGNDVSPIQVFQLPDNKRDEIKSE